MRTVGLLVDNFIRFNAGLHLETLLQLFHQLTEASGSFIMFPAFTMQMTVPVRDVQQITFYTSY